MLIGRREINKGLKLWQSARELQERILKYSTINALILVSLKSKDPFIHHQAMEE